MRCRRAVEADGARNSTSHENSSDQKQTASGQKRRGPGLESICLAKPNVRIDACGRCNQGWSVWCGCEFERQPIPALHEVHCRSSQRPIATFAFARHRVTGDFAITTPSGCCAGNRRGWRAIVAGATGDERTGVGCFAHVNVWLSGSRRAAQQYALAPGWRPDRHNRRHAYSHDQIRVHVIPV